MSGTKNPTKRIVGLVLWIAVLTAIVSIVAFNIGIFSNSAVVLLGFGMVVLVHEFGHFIVAKIGGIKVEAFSIFMPPVLIGMRRTQDGIKIRILPRLFGQKDEKADDGSVSLTGGKRSGASETEYRIGLIPFGGFVKLLGQDDTGPVKAIDDPRSFANKPVGVRMAVIAAGVTFNVVSAAIIFVTVFLVGIRLSPAVVGGVFPDSPAAKAGLKAGDEIVEIAGKSRDLDFSNVMIAAALSDANELVPVRVRREDGTEKEFRLVAEQLPGGSMREFGILEPLSLTIAEVSDANALLKRTGLLPGDRVRSINGTEVRTEWQLNEIIRDTLLPEATIGVERAKRGGREPAESRIKLELTPGNGEAESEAELGHICSMVPRLRITAVAQDVVSVDSGRSVWGRITQKLDVWLGTVDVATEPQAGSKTETKLQVGDIVQAVGDVEYPTYKEFRDVTREYEGKKLPVKVLRADANGVESTVTITVEPRRAPGRDKVVIGIGIALDGGHAVVAKTIEAKNGPARLEIPRGAQITAINGKPVSSFYDCISEIRRLAGQRITINYRLGEQQVGGVVLDVGADKDSVSVKSAPVESLPFRGLDRLYQAQGPIDALGMGYRRTTMFIAQTYVTLRRLIGGLISPKHLIGPVGIIAFSYRIVSEQPLVYYAYFLGLVSATIAVMNFLPLPPFDGGLIVLMLIEKVRGSALSEKAQGVIAYAGWVLVGTLLLYVTFNDIVRSFFS